MQACSLCTCHKEKQGNLTLRRFHGILGLNKQQVANHVLVRILASWGWGCTRLHSYHFAGVGPPVRWPHREGSSALRIGQCFSEAIRMFIKTSSPR